MLAPVSCFIIFQHQTNEQLISVICPSAFNTVVDCAPLFVPIKLYITKKLVDVDKMPTNERQVSNLINLYYV